MGTRDWKREQPAETFLTVARKWASSELKERVQLALELLRTPVTESNEYEYLKARYSTWDEFNAHLLSVLFTTDEFQRQYKQPVIGAMTVSFYGRTLKENRDQLERTIWDKIRKLEWIRERLKLIQVYEPVSLSETKSSTSDTVVLPESGRVLIVHDRDEQAKNALEAMLYSFRLEPVALHRELGDSRTVTEKFETYTNIKYAFILLSPDDLAQSVFGGDSRNEQLLTAEHRERGNVIFEFEYLVGKLGEKRVCCLYTRGASLPTDVAGLVYKKFESNVYEKKHEIRKELLAAGYTV